jgi:NAD dependent epimerase/dehydratase family
MRLGLLPLVLLASSEALAPAGKRLLVLGGTGFVGGNVCNEASSRGWTVTSLSRRGRVEGADVPQQVQWVKGDASDPTVVYELVERGKFDGFVHAIGMLLDNKLNRFASGSGSVPDEGATYDRVTRATVFAAADAIVAARKPGQVSEVDVLLCLQQVSTQHTHAFRLAYRARCHFIWRACLVLRTSVDAMRARTSPRRQLTHIARRRRPPVAFADHQPPTPFVFISAAEAAWTRDSLLEGTPLDFLRRYLVAKRAAEERLLGDTLNLRATVLRPSLLWTRERLGAIPVSAAAHCLGALYACDGGH